MTRRTFLGASTALAAQERVPTGAIPMWNPDNAGEATLFDPTAPFASQVGQSGWRGSPSDDLVDRCRLTLTGTLLHHIRPNGLPYFNLGIDYKTGEVHLPPEGTVWDRISQTGRSVHAILLAREMTGDWNTLVENEHKIRKVLLADFQPDGFNYLENNSAMMHDQNRSLLGVLQCALRASGERERRQYLEYGDKLVAAFLRTATRLGAALSMPGAYYSPQKGFYDLARAPGNHGRTIGPLVLYARATGNQDALRVAEGYANHVLYISDSFRFDRHGGFLGFGDESLHVHSVGATVAGLALLGMELNRREYVERARAIYEYGLKVIGNEFGWIPEANPDAPVNRARRRMLRQTTCEGCSITDYIESAIYLAQAGYTEYWADAERYLRNHHLESQMTTVDWVKSPGPVDMKPRMLGSFTARSSPNRMYDLYHVAGPVGCCNAAGVVAFYLAWRHGLSQNSRGVHVNLLFSRETGFAKVVSELPRRGRVSVTMKTASDLYLRIPEWTRHAITYSPAQPDASWHGPFQRIPALAAGQTVTVEFPLRRASREWLQTTMNINYKTDWLGDTVVAIAPRGNCFPLYERSYLL